MVDTKEQRVTNILFQGDKIDLGEEVTVDEARGHLESIGFGDYVNSRTPVVRGDTLVFEQINAEKG